MNFVSFIEGPFLRIAFALLFLGTLTRLTLLISGVVARAREQDARWRAALLPLGRSFFPFHQAVKKRPLYALLRYLYHGCMFVVPVYLWGHVVLWEESRFELSWNTLPDIWADRLTVFFIFLTFCFLCRRLVVAEVRHASSLSDYVLPAVVALPFLSGYFLAQGTFNGFASLEERMWTIHVICAEMMMIAAAFLIARSRFQTKKCTGCATCASSCPTGALTYEDSGSVRIFTSDDSRCIHCGACVRDCPESAVDLGHQVAFIPFLGSFGRQTTRAFELQECVHCGIPFAPETQWSRMEEVIEGSYPRLCPRCRGTSLMGRGGLVPGTSNRGKITV
jgi:ferredoxin